MLGVFCIFLPGESPLELEKETIMTDLALTCRHRAQARIPTLVSALEGSSLCAISVARSQRRCSRPHLLCSLPSLPRRVHLGRSHRRDGCHITIARPGWIFCLDCCRILRRLCIIQSSDTFGHSRWSCSRHGLVRSNTGVIEARHDL